MCNSSSIKYKTSMIRSDLCDYSDAYILVSGTITITGAGDDDNGKGTGKRNRGVIFKNCASFTSSISSTNNIQIDNTEYNNVYI